MGNYLKELTELMNDSLTNKVALFHAEASKYTDQAIRERFLKFLEMTGLHGRISGTIKMKFIQLSKPYCL